MATLAPRRAPAAGAALPHADPRLLADGRRPPTTSSTGSRTRSATTWRAWCSPSRRRAHRHGRPGRRPDRHQPVRLLRRGVGRALPVRLRPHAGTGTWPPTSQADEPGPLLAQWLGSDADRGPRHRPGTPIHRRLPRRRSTSGSAARSPTRPAWSPACRPPTRRSRRRSARAATAPGCSCRSCAASGSRPGSSPATSCSSRADEAPLDGPSGPDRRLHRPPRLGRGVRPGRGLDRSRPHLGPVRRRRPPPPRLLAASRRARRRSTGATEPCEVTLRVRQHRPPPRRGRPASPCPTPTSSGRGIDALGARGRRRRSRPATCASPWAASPRSSRSTTWRRAEWTTAADGADKRRLARGARPPPARPLRARRPAPPRAGQVVPGRAAAPLADRAAAGGPTASRCGTTPPCSPTRWTAPPASADAEAVADAAVLRRGDRRRASACPTAAACPRTRIRCTGSCRGQPARRRPSGRRCRPDDDSLADQRRPPRRRRRPRRARPGRPRRLGRPAASRGPTAGATIGDDRGGRRPAGRCAGATSSSSPATRRMGLRLPLDALTWRPAPPADPEPSPFDDRRPLPGRMAAAATPAPQRRGGRTREGAARRAVRRGPQGQPLRVPARRSSTSSTPSTCSRPSRHAAADLGRPVVLEGYLPPIDPRLVRLVVTPDPGVIEVNVHPASSWPELVDITTGVHAEARATRLGTETFHLDGTHAGTGGGNHMTLGGPDAGRQPAAAPPRPAPQPHHLLAAPPVALVPVLRPVHRPHQPGAPRRRGPPRQPLRARDRLRRARPPDRDQQRPGTALARRPPVPPPARRRHRQHPPGRVLHRQAVQPGLRAGPARAPRAARLRDAAPPPDGAGAGAAGAGARGPLLGRAVSGPARALGHRAPRPLPAAVLRRGRHRRGGRRPRPPRVRLRPRLAGAVPRVPLPPHRCGRRRRSHPRAASRHRAVAGARRGGDRPPAPPATSTRRSSGCRCGVAGSPPTATS